VTRWLARPAAINGRGEFAALFGMTTTTEQATWFGAL
jgi:hypothetical protein